MPKMKTRRSAAKRFQATGNLANLNAQKLKRHILEKNHLLVSVITCFGLVSKADQNAYYECFLTLKINN